MMMIMIIKMNNLQIVNNLDIELKEETGIRSRVEGIFNMCMTSVCAQLDSY